MTYLERLDMEKMAETIQFLIYHLDKPNYDKGAILLSLVELYVELDKYSRPQRFAASTR